MSRICAVLSVRISLRDGAAAAASTAARLCRVRPARLFSSRRQLSWRRRRRRVFALAEYRALRAAPAQSAAGQTRAPPANQTRRGAYCYRHNQLSVAAVAAAAKSGGQTRAAEPLAALANRSHCDNSPAGLLSARRRRLLPLVSAAAAALYFNGLQPLASLVASPRLGRRKGVSTSCSSRKVRPAGRPREEGGHLSFYWLVCTRRPKK